MVDELECIRRVIELTFDFAMLTVAGSSSRSIFALTIDLFDRSQVFGIV